MNKRHIAAIFILLLLLFNQGCNSLFEQFVDSRKQHYFREGKKLYDKQAFKEALPWFDKALVIDSDFFDAYFIKAKTYEQLGDYDNAQAIIGKCLELKPDSIDLQLLRTEFVVKAAENGQKTRPTIIIRTTEQILQKDPNNTKAKMYKITGLLLKDGPKYIHTAQQEIHSLLHTLPEEQRLYNHLAEIHIRKNQLQKALELLLQHAGDTDQWKRIMEKLAQQYEDRFMVEKVKECYNIIIQEVEDKYPYQLRLVGFLKKYKVLNEATSLLKTIIADHPDDLAIRKKHILLLLETKKFQEAIKVTKAILEQDTKNPDFKYLLILCYAKQGNIQAMTNEANKTLATLPAASRSANKIRACLAEEHFQKGDLSEASTITNETISHSPTNFTARFMLCKIALEQGDHRYAISNLRVLIADSPNNPELPYYLGLCHLTRNDTIFSIRAFTDALSTDPLHKNSLLKLFEISLKTGKTGGCKKSVERYLALKPADADIVAIQKQLGR